jgi:hypothetical protein
VTLSDEAGIATPVVAADGAAIVTVGVDFEAATRVLTDEGHGMFAALLFVSLANDAYHQYVPVVVPGLKPAPLGVQLPSPVGVAVPTVVQLEPAHVDGALAEGLVDR